MDESDDDMDFDLSMVERNSPSPVRNEKHDESDSSFGSRFSHKPEKGEKEELMKRYEELQEESRAIDEAAKQIKTLMLTCRQMEDCYSKRVIDSKGVRNFVEIRYLADESILFIMNIENSTDYPMDGWNLGIRWSTSNPKLFISQTVDLDSMPPGVSKSYEIHISSEDVDLPIVFHLSLNRHFEFQEVIRGFRVEIDPICFSYWDIVQVPKRTAHQVATSFNFSIRLPFALIDLLCGCPDTLSTTNLFRALLPRHITEKMESNTSEMTLTIQISRTQWQMLKMHATKESTYYNLRVSTENSKLYLMLKEHLQMRLIIEMSKVRQKPENSITILPEMENLERVFESMISAFY